ncbi:MAG: hypothetical protein ACREUL_16790 [Steroidobacteraceae bacterium]
MVKRIEQGVTSPVGALTDQDVTAGENELLYYHTAAFETDTEVSAFFKLIAWLSVDHARYGFLGGHP